MVNFSQLPENNCRIRELTLEEGRALVDRLAWRHLGVSGNAFMRAWDAGELDEHAERPEIVHLVMLLPFAR